MTILRVWDILVHIWELKFYFYLKVSIKVKQKSRLLLFYQMENDNILIEINETHPGGILRVFLRNGLFSPWYSYRSYSYKKKRVLSTSGWFTSLEFFYFPAGMPGKTSELFRKWSLECFPGIGRFIRPYVIFWWYEFHIFLFEGTDFWKYSKIIQNSNIVLLNNFLFIIINALL